MSKILKNTTGSDIFLADVGQTVPASSQITIDPQDYHRYSYSANTVAQINSGNIIVNDGIADLTLTQGIGFVQSTSGQVFYDSTNNELLGRFESTLRVVGLIPTTVSATGSTSTTSGTYATINSMSITKNSGTYFVLFTGTTTITGNGDGDVALFLDGVEISGTAKKIAVDSSALLGSSTDTTGTVTSLTIATISGSQTITARFRENGNDTLSITNRLLLMFPISR